ncbi:MAG: hypothetical protein OXI73_08920 [Rhodospirillales bacterium]|nr:hypothetical protein [Rhodospirillales bacterium]
MARSIPRKPDGAIDWEKIIAWVWVVCLFATAFVIVNWLTYIRMS